MNAPTYARSALTAAAALFLLVGLALPTAAQETGQIRGTVVDAASARPLAGAQVFITGTGIGGLTSSDGVFLLLNVPTGQHTVSVQLVGYGAVEQSVTVQSGQTATAEFEMEQQAILLNEIVVTGAGQATERRRLGNTVASINVAEELADAPIRSASDVLQAREPGVTVTQGGGLAGEGSQIQIRGSASLSQSNGPIIYVDGVRVDNSFGFGTSSNSSRLDDINPESIERVEVLKGAAAATLYGTEASNGVVQIFTKQGQAGAPRWTFEAGGGIAMPYESRYEPLSGFALAEEPTIGRDRGTQGIAEYWGIDVEPYEVFSVSIPDLIMETGRNQDYALSVSGGSDFLTYNVGGRYSWADGIHGGNQYGPLEDLESHKQANANLTIFPSEKLRLQVSTRYTDRHHTPTEDGTPNSAISITMLAKPEFATENNPAGWRAFATLPEAMQIVQAEDTKRFGGAVTASYSVTPELNLEATAGVDIVNQLASEFRPFGWNVSGVTNTTPEGYRQIWDRNHSEVTVDSKGSWNTDLTDQFSSSLVFGLQTHISNTHTSESVGEQFPGPGLEVTGAGAIQTNDEFILRTVNAGVFAQEQVAFRDYLFVTGGVRFDQHSAFGEAAGGAVYPKVSFSFVPSDMPVWSEIGPLSTLRLRGAVGNSGLQPGAFDKFTTFSPLASETGPGVEPDNLGNPDLKPEVSTEWEAGFEAGLFNDRYAFEGTYWNRTVTDLLVPRAFPPSGGFLNTQLDNVGEMKSWGVELGVNGTVYNGRNFSLAVFTNAAYLHELVTDMGGAPSIYLGSGGRRRNWVKEGYAPGAFFGGKLVDADYPIDIDRDGEPDSQERMLEYFSTPRSPDEVHNVLLVADEDGDGDLIDHYLGKPNPDWSGAFGADVSFLSNFTLSSLFEYQAGNVQVQNHTEGFRYSHRTLGRNTPEAAQVESTLLNPASSPEQRLKAAKRFAETGAALDAYNGLNQVQDADFIRWRELSLTYRVPSGLADRIGADGISLTASGRNIMLWTEYPGIDPETRNGVTRNLNLGYDAHKLGLPRQFSLSARVNF